MRPPHPLRRTGLLLSIGVLVLTGCAGQSGAGPTPMLSSTAPTSPAAAPTGSVPQPSPPTPPSSTATAPASAKPSGPPGPRPDASCAARVRRLSVSEQVGQLLMVAVSSTRLSASDAETLADVHAGSVLLLGNSTLGVAKTKRLVGRVRGAAAPPNGVSTMVAADQEGGLVQRLKGSGFSTMPSAQVQASWSDRKLRAEAANWGEQLARAGIDANLAPVADVVPTNLARINQPIGQLRRGYGPSAKTVATKVTAFDRGMDTAGIATAAKHFPGLGRVRGNTDFSADVVDSVTSRHDEDLAGFQALVEARADMVMVSSATYTKIDRRHRAVFSSEVISGMVRGDLGFSGVVISDDLSAAALADVAPGDRAIRFVEAGGDLAIVGDPQEARTMAAALARRAKKDHGFGLRVADSAGRVVAMKARRGQADCTPG